MVDKVAAFVLNLKGYRFRGHAKYWSYNEEDRCFAWIMNDELSLQTEPWLTASKFHIIDDLAFMTGKYFTLGTEMTHLELMHKANEKLEGVYTDPNETTYKLPNWPD